LTSDLPYRYPISISHIRFGSHLVTLLHTPCGAAAAKEKREVIKKEAKVGFRI